MANPSSGSGSGVSGHAFFVTMLAAAAGVGFFGYVGDYVTAGVVAATAVGALFGYWKGALGFVAVGAAIAGGYYLAAPVNEVIGPYVGSIFSGMGPGVQLGLSGVLAAALTQLIVLLVGKSILSRNEVLGDFNRTVGIGLGGVQMLAAAGLLLCGVLTIEPTVQSAAPYSSASSASQGVASSVTVLAEQTRRSAIHPLLVQYDPFQRFPALRQSLQNYSQPKAATPAPTAPSSFQQNSLAGWLTNNTNPGTPPSGPLNVRSLQDLFPASGRRN